MLHVKAEDGTFLDNVSTRMEPRPFLPLEVPLSIRELLHHIEEPVPSAGAQLLMPVHYTTACNCLEIQMFPTST